MSVKELEDLSREDVMEESLQTTLEAEFSEAYGCPKCKSNALKMGITEYNNETIDVLKCLNCGFIVITSQILKYD